MPPAPGWSDTPGQRTDDMTNLALASAHGTWPPITSGRRGALHWLALALVWVAVASGSVVFAEPAPVDLITIVLVGFLPLIGLVRVSRGLVLVTALWIVAGVAALLAAIAAPDLLFQRATTHAAISIYLYLAFFVFAGFVALAPDRHVRLILGAYVSAAAITSIAGVTGYLGLVPGAEELFTKHARAAGTFKDPNVFGAFLVPAAIYALHLSITRPLATAAAAASALGVIALAILLSFSRGAWVNLVAAATLYVYLAVVLAGSSLQRLRLLTLGTIAAAAVLVGLAIVLETPEIDRLFAERASLSQAYDEGPEGRFGGQQKALRLIAENPFGIGALVFAEVHHVEDVHNVYLSMFLNAGWLGGFLYLILVAVTCLYGFNHALKRTPTQPLFLVVYAAFVATVLEGFVIDTDHWRHFYLLMALLWGMMTAPALSDHRTRARPARLIRDRRLRPIVLPARLNARGRNRARPAALIVKREPGKA